MAAEIPKLTLGERLKMIELLMLRRRDKRELFDWISAPEVRWILAGGEAKRNHRKFANQHRAPAGARDVNEPKAPHLSGVPAGTRTFSRL